MDKNDNICIIGCGNIGSCIAKGIFASKLLPPQNIILTRRNVGALSEFKEQGFVVTANNVEALKKSKMILICVSPFVLNDILLEIREFIEPKHTLVPVVTGAGIADIRAKINRSDIPYSIVRAMPNTAISCRESMTCLATDEPNCAALKLCQEVFNSCGSSNVIREDQMIAATALCACGIAFFARAIRAASQGGVEIGFHSEEAIMMAAQTAKGAASLLLQNKSHPEAEVDKVTTPQGCTITGLNQMEHNGFSSALIKGIVSSCEKAAFLYKKTS